MTRLPAGWHFASVQQLAGAQGLTSDGDWIESKDQSPNGGVRLVQLADIGDGEFRNRSERFVTQETALRLRCTFLQPDDVLIARMPDPLGRACVFPRLGQPAIAAVDVFIWRTTRDGALSRWLMHSINTKEVRVAIAAQAGGTTRQRIAGGRLKQLPLPVPPLPEQRRIVAKIDSLSAKSKRARDHLDHIPRLVEKYKQAILAAAFRGDLTREWRRSRKTNEIANSLDDVRRQRIRSNLTSQRARALGSLPNPKPNLPSIPKGWAWACIEEIAADEPRSIQSGPFGSSLLHSEFRKEGRLVIGIDNVQDGHFSLGSQNRISNDKFVELQRFEACPNDILITVMATVGRVCVVPPDIEPAIITKHVYRIGVDMRLALPKFVMHGLQGAEVALEHMGANTRGQTRPGINGEILKSLFLPLPSLTEQRKILNLIETGFAWIERLAADATSARKLIDNLDQAILAKAFRGELVPQDPNDEPASELLERIKASNGTTPAGKRSAAQKRSPRGTKGDQPG
jgi:type I restriction enzyme S subunit